MPIIAHKAKLFSQKPLEMKDAQTKKIPWSLDEKEKFIEALRMYGKDYVKIKEHIGTRNTKQITSFASKFKLKCNKR